MELTKALDQVSEAATKLGFVQSSDRELGRLLRLLCCSRPRGRFLELGTGVGFGAAWMLAGMTPEARLVSVEQDGELQAVASHVFRGDQRVQWVLGDGSDWLRTAVEQTERFDVVFADTWPGKYQDRELAMELVKPGGWYVIDDLYPQPGWPEGHQYSVDLLIQELTCMPGWEIEFLPWSSGLMLCVKTKSPVDPKLEVPPILHGES
ncbi:SAM-dependent methyltransferase [Tessaracoccus rhinocerotis]|uniref:SAM-dependent methyltransferase n=1 Tax=Tessaracoccus rhinocerotis TaxID=1689449 RepID=A0A553K3Z1_9ACTN|nr:class I SAM-dependent methyltransferase [Tessaracoccus rhinocerotis]TRY19427.1 SAM-dependent methyltransferase [Tessaracoccus rhinocerotis]